jgi:Predicted kinase related to galactokinase and mevalonate kinase
MTIVISRTPFRVSFFGGGTDYPAWFRNNGGRVLSTTIDKYCYITCRHLPPFFNIRHRIVWSHIETVQNISEILHPAVREGLGYLGFTDRDGIEIHHQGDLPARAGMGTSSSFAVGLIHALLTLRGERPSKARLTEMAIFLEQERMGDKVGSQDQAAVAHGGFNVIDFHKDGRIEVTPVGLPEERQRQLEDHLILFYTGASRFASDIAADVIQNIPANEKQLRRMYELVGTATAIVSGDGALDAFGHLLDETWHLKRQLSARVSTDRIDAIYARARQAGALGGKLLGAGTSGFMLFFAPPERHDAIRNALGDLLHVPFRFENEGATILTSPSSYDRTVAYKADRQMETAL